MNIGQNSSLSKRVGATTRRLGLANASFEGRLAQAISSMHMSDKAKSSWQSDRGHLISGVASIESMNPETVAIITNADTEVIDDIGAAIIEAATSPEEGNAIINDLTPAQVDAAAISAAAFGGQQGALENFRTLAQSVSKPQATVDDWSRTSVVNPGTGFGYTETSMYSAEAYDARNLTAFIGDTVTFNLHAARQRDFGEAFYPTITLTPDQTGLDLTIRRTMILNAKRHEYNGTFTDFNRRNIIDALLDSSVLADGSTDIIPNYLDGDVKNNALFGKGLTPTEYTFAEGVKIKTAPLRPNTEISLIGIGQNVAINAGGQLNQTDAIDQAVWLKSLVFRLGTSEAAADNFEFDLSGLADTMFLKGPNGNRQRISLNFFSEDIVLNAATKNYDGQKSTALDFMQVAPYNQLQVRLSIQANANLDLETGRCNLVSGNVGIASILEPDGANGMRDVTAENIIADIRTKLLGVDEVVGYRVKATYSNVNRRNAGIFINVFEERTLYVVPLGAPITLQTPLTGTRTNADMAAPIAAARARNENNAVTQLLKFYEQLNAIKPLLSYGTRRCKAPRIEGIGHTVVYPFVDNVSVDLTRNAQGVKSSERQADVAATLTNTIRDLSYNMWIKSGWQAAAETIGANVVKPTLIIGTDPEIERHLMDVGDTRLAGIYFTYKVVSTLDLRMRGKIVLAFQVPSTGRANPLAFGCMAYIPELVTTLQQPREGANSRETMVQPRTLHVNTCPIMGMIEVKGIRPAVTGTLAVPMNMSMGG